MNNPETSVSVRGLAESVLAFAAGGVLGLILLTANQPEARMGLVLSSPLLAFCLVPACVARLYHEVWRHALSRGAYLTVWFVAGSLFACGWGVAFVQSRGPVLIDALDLLGGAILGPVIFLIYCALGPFLSPLVVALVVPRRFRLHASPPSAV